MATSRYTLMPDEFPPRPRTPPECGKNEGKACEPMSSLEATRQSWRLLNDRFRERPAARYPRSSLVEWFEAGAAIGAAQPNDRLKASYIRCTRMHKGLSGVRILLGYYDS